MSTVYYGIYDGIELIASVEGPEFITESSIQSELGYAFSGMDISTVLHVRESSGVQALNRIFG